MVDFYRPAKTPKDVPDWKGPAKVVSVESPETGTLTIQWQGRDAPSPGGERSESYPVRPCGGLRGDRVGPSKDPAGVRV